MNWTLRTIGLWLATACLTPVCVAQTASYSIVPSVTSLPAGSHGASLSATVKNLPQGSTFNVCFYTGFGDMAPIVPDSSLYSANSASISFKVDPTSIQDVPPASFSAGVSHRSSIPSTRRSPPAPAPARLKATLQPYPSSIRR